MSDGDILTKTYVWCTLSFSGFHYWREAEGKVAYLRSLHRHVFHVKASKIVGGLNREVEFITLKEQMEDYVNEKYSRKTVEASCEMIAHDLLEQFDLAECSVSEDQENGARVVRIGGG